MALQQTSSRNTPPAVKDGVLTPPSSTAPKTTKRVNRLLRSLKDYQEGRPSRSPNLEYYSLATQEYEELIHILQHNSQLWGFFVDKIQYALVLRDKVVVLTTSSYDYNRLHGRFLLRMPTTLHDTFISLLVAETRAAISNLSNKTAPRVKAYLEAIESISGALVIPLDGSKDGEQSRFEPDIRFQHKDAAWPGLVFEVAHSQSGKALAELADTYILGSYGGITTVVGIDLGYRRTKAATFSIWRLKSSIGDDGELEGEAHLAIDKQLFRDATGAPVLLPSADMSLSIKDFTVSELNKDIPDVPLIITSATLCRLLESAEKWDNKATSTQGVAPRPFKRKWRQQTPPEQLSVSDEDRMLEDERRVRRKHERVDTNYEISEPSSQS